jgi:hypothetical protein
MIILIRVEDSALRDMTPGQSVGAVADMLLGIPPASLNPHQLANLQNDVENLMENNATNEKVLRVAKGHVEYPNQPELNASTVFHFSNDVSKFSPMFLELLRSVYQGASTGGMTHYRINLVKSDGAIHALEFSSQESYWGCIRCLILIYRRAEVEDFRCNCRIGNVNDAQKKAYKYTRGDSFDDCSCSVSGARMVMSSLIHPEQELFHVDVLLLAAVTLSADHETMRPYLWQVSCCMGQDLTEESEQLAADLTYKISAGATVLKIGSLQVPVQIPVSREDVVRGEGRDGPLNIFFSGSRIVSMLNPSNYYNTGLATTPHCIGTDEAGGLDVCLSSTVLSLPVASFVQAFRLVIKRAADIYYISKDGTLPSPYCTGYLLDAASNKMTKVPHSLIVKISSHDQS